MSNEIKLRWEEVTRWILRIAVGVMSLVFAVAGNAVVGLFSETRSDMKQLLKEHTQLEGRVKAVEDRTLRNEGDIDRYIKK